MSNLHLRTRTFNLLLTSSAVITVSMITAVKTIKTPKTIDFIDLIQFTRLCPRNKHHLLSKFIKIIGWVSFKLSSHWLPASKIFPVNFIKYCHACLCIIFLCQDLSLCCSCYHCLQLYCLFFLIFYCFFLLVVFWTNDRFLYHQLSTLMNFVVC